MTSAKLIHLFARSDGKRRTTLSQNAGADTGSAEEVLQSARLGKILESPA